MLGYREFWRKSEEVMMGRLWECVDLKSGYARRAFGRREACSETLDVFPLYHIKPIENRLTRLCDQNSNIKV